MFLPVNQHSATPLLFAKASSIACIRLPSGTTADIIDAIEGSPVTLQAFRCMEFGEEDIIYLGTFFAEWKRNLDLQTTCYRATFHALAMQSQRRALGLEDRYVYGLVQTKGFLHLVASCWVGPSLVRAFPRDNYL